MSTVASYCRRADHGRLLVFLLAATLFAFAFGLIGCGSTGGAQTNRSPVVSALNIYSADGSQLMGTARWDGRKLLIFGLTKGDAEVWIKGNGIPIFGPVLIDEAGALYRDADTGQSWRGNLHEPLPPGARELFRPAEVAAYHIPFADDVVPASG